MKPIWVLLVWTIAASMGLMSVHAADTSTPNSYVEVVLKHLADVQYRLPAGDFILLAFQPEGIAHSTIVYDLDNSKIVHVPGHHIQGKISSLPLSKEKAALLRDAVGLEAIKSLPRESGHVGLDGAAFVAVIKIGKRKQFIGHWEPDSPAIELLEAIYEHEVQAFDRRGQLKEAGQPNQP